MSIVELLGHVKIYGTWSSQVKEVGLGCVIAPTEIIPIAIKY